MLIFDDITRAIIFNIQKFVKSLIFPHDDYKLVLNFFAIVFVENINGNKGTKLIQLVNFGWFTEQIQNF